MRENSSKRQRWKETEKDEQERKIDTDIIIKQNLKNQTTMQDIRDTRLHTEKLTG